MQSAPAARSLRLSLSRLLRCRSSLAARMTLRVDTSIATPTAFRDPLWENELIEKIRITSCRSLGEDVSIFQVKAAMWSVCEWETHSSRERRSS